MVYVPIFIRKNDGKTMTKGEMACCAIVAITFTLMLIWSMSRVWNQLRVYELHGRRYEGIVAEIEAAPYRPKTTYVTIEDGTKAIYYGKSPARIGDKVTIQERENKKGTVERTEAYLIGEDIYLSGQARKK